MQCIVNNYQYAVGEAKECWCSLQLSPTRTKLAKTPMKQQNGKAIDATRQRAHNKNTNGSSSDNSKSSSRSSNSSSNEDSTRCSHSRCRRKPVDVLHFLGTCSNAQLMIVVFAFRIFAVIFMSFCHRILPLLFGLDSLVFDTCQELYDDTRFAFLRNWDAVHFYHIAQHGYSHDNVCAFFPFVPMIIRAVSFVTSPEVLPILRVIAPVSLYVTLINITASCLGAVVLRDLTRMTFLESQDETHEKCKQIHEFSDDRSSHINVCDDVKIVKVDNDANTEEYKKCKVIENVNIHSSSNDENNNVSSVNDIATTDQELIKCEQQEEQLIPTKDNDNERQTTSEIMEEKEEEQEEELCKDGTWLTSIKSETQSHNLSEEHVKENNKVNVQSNFCDNVTDEQNTSNAINERVIIDSNSNSNNNYNSVNSNVNGEHSLRKESKRTQLARSNGEEGSLLDRFAAMTFALRESTVWQNYMKYENINASQHYGSLCESAVERAKQQDEHKRTAEGRTNTHEKNKEEQQQKCHTNESFTFMQTGQRIVGGALLMWIISPAMIFTVVNYTESLFALFTMYGIYLINHAPSFIRKGMISNVFTENDTKMQSPTALVKRETCKCRQLYEKICTFAIYVCALSSKEELLATLCFVIACSIRSNAILCGGFLLYPMFLALVFPREYARRYRLHLWCTSSSNKVSQISSTSVKTAKNISVWSLPLAFVLCRIAVLVMECACIMIPYLLLNYHCWRSFAHTWSLEEQAKMSNGKFFRFYSLLQHRYWNVGFLTSYTIANLPNVLLALPITTLIFHGMELFYMRPILQEWLGRESTQKMVSSLRRLYIKIKYLPSANKCDLSDAHIKDNKGKNTVGKSLPQVMHNTWSANKEIKEFTTCTLLSLYELIGLLTQSCNVVYLCALTFIALTMMHIQVSTRFLSSCPAVYWFAGLQLALYPTSGVSRLLIAYCTIYGLVGGVLFANHMPWT